LAGYRAQIDWQQAGSPTTIASLQTFVREPAGTGSVDRGYALLLRPQQKVTPAGK